MRLLIQKIRYQISEEKFSDALLRPEDKAHFYTLFPQHLFQPIVQGSSEQGWFTSPPLCKQCECGGHLINAFRRTFRPDFRASGFFFYRFIIEKEKLASTWKKLTACLLKCFILRLTKHTVTKSIIVYGQFFGQY